jgi:hypothetical protein
VCLLPVNTEHSNEIHTDERLTSFIPAGQIPFLLIEVDVVRDVHELLPKPAQPQLLALSQPLGLAFSLDVEKTGLAELRGTIWLQIQESIDWVFVQFKRLEDGIVYAMAVMYIVMAVMC